MPRSMSMFSDIQEAILLSCHCLLSSLATNGLCTKKVDKVSYADSPGAALSLSSIFEDNTHQSANGVSRGVMLGSVSSLRRVHLNRWICKNNC